VSSFIGGVLLSPDIFNSPWFDLLASFVAFNTLIYVGLTLAKVIPWPSQLRTIQLRVRLEKWLFDGTRTEDEHPVRAHPGNSR
jgi:hypothetical protein